jgi:hypothetical protein
MRLGLKIIIIIKMQTKSFLNKLLVVPQLRCFHAKAAPAAAAAAPIASLKDRFETAFKARSE